LLESGCKLRFGKSHFEIEPLPIASEQR
jgi:hypothetical protein